MIQRKQTIWLALAAIFEGLTFKLPFYTGDWKEDTTPAAIPLNAGTTALFTALTAFIITAAIIAIFNFKKRKQQQFVAAVGAGATLAALGLYAFEITDFLSGSPAFTIVVYVAVVIFFLLALRGIRADEKLIKSMDRLR